MFTLEISTQSFLFLSIEIDFHKFGMGHNVDNLRVLYHRKEDNENLRCSELIQHPEEIHTEGFLIMHQEQPEVYNMLQFTDPRRIHK